MTIHGSTMPPESEPPVLWSRVMDQQGLIHMYWRRNFTGSKWHRSCQHRGPTITSQSVDLPATSLVTCLWCVSDGRAA